ncbi:hypothetical protein [Geodermatophilus sp. CPCC 205761]|uniref:hypothetical protein n=1 Tax=Geodermatophilus sp. CPCC 205761 TaxID=2936597 RepID=UPI003EED6CC4
MHVGVADHLGWAVTVTTSADHEVLDRRRIELVGTGLPVAPIHHEGGAWPQHTSRRLDDAALASLVAQVRASAALATAESLDRLAADLAGPILSISLRASRSGLPADIAALRRPPYESRADAVMYRHVLAEVAEARGWRVHLYDPKQVLDLATARLGADAGRVLDGPRARWGPPWTRDHRTAVAATVVAAKGCPDGSP